MNSKRVCRHRAPTAARRVVHDHICGAWRALRVRSPRRVRPRRVRPRRVRPRLVRPCSVRPRRVRPCHVRPLVTRLVVLWMWRMSPC